MVFLEPGCSAVESHENGLQPSTASSLVIIQGSGCIDVCGILLRLVIFTGTNILIALCAQEHRRGGYSGSSEPIIGDFRSLTVLLLWFG